MKPTHPKKQNQTVLDAFVEHRDVLAGYLARKMLKAEDIDDLLQETFIQAHRAEGKRSIESPKGYLFVIARNLLSKKFAKQSKERTRIISEAEFATLQSEEAPADQHLHYKLQMNVLEDAVRSLPPQCRRVFVLRKFYGMPNKKIAKELDISTSTVERHITIALTRLSVIMKKGGYELEAMNWQNRHVDGTRPIR